MFASQNSCDTEQAFAEPQLHTGTNTSAVTPSGPHAHDYCYQGKSSADDDIPSAAAQQINTVSSVSMNQPCVCVCVCDHPTTNSYDSEQR